MQLDCAVQWRNFKAKVLQEPEVSEGWPVCSQFKAFVPNMDFIIRIAMRVYQEY